MKHKKTKTKVEQGSQPKAKILSLRQATSLILPYRRQKILVTGGFDIIHQEHLKLLKKAKKLGGYLFVGLESDQRLRNIKGKNRPINSLSIRLQNLARLPFVDYVFPLPSQFGNPSEHENFIRRFQPTILAVSENTPHLQEKQAILSKYKARVQIVHRHNPAISTTKIIACLQPHQSDH